MAFNAGDIEAKLKLDRTPFQRELDKAIRSGREFEKMRFTATLDADKKPFTKALNAARAAGVRFSQTKYDTKLGVDRTELGRALKAASRDINQLAGTRGKASIGLDSGGLQSEVKKIKRLTHDAGIQVMNNFRSPWRRFKWPAIFAGITAAAAAVPPALVGVGGAVAALAGAFIGPVKAMGAFAKMTDAIESGSDDAAAKIRIFEEQMAKLAPEARAFVTQAVNMRDEMSKFGKAMQSATLPGFTTWLQGVEASMPAITRGAGAVGAALSEVAAEAGQLMKSPAFQGHIEQAFKNSVPVVKSLGRFISNLTRDMIIFTSQTKTLGIGLGNMVDGLSRGFTGFFRELTPYSDTLGRSFAAIGDIVGDLFTALGKFSGILSTGLAPGLEILRNTLGNIYDVVNNLVAGALPGLTTAWAGVGSAIGGVASALAPIAGLIGSAVGVLAPFAVGLKAIDMISFGRVGASITTLKGNVKAAEGAAGKAKMAFRGLATIGFGPLGVAALALGGVLTLLGQRQREAADRAAEHRTRVDELTQALIDDGGAVGAVTRAVAAKSLADQGALRTTREFGYSVAEVTTAATGNKEALDRVNTALDNRIAATTRAMKAEGAAAGQVNDTVRGLDHQRGRLIELKGALNNQARAAKEAEQQALLTAAAENGVSVATLKHYNSLIKLNSEMMKAVDANLSYREAVHNTKQAIGAVNKLVKEGKKGTAEHTTAVHASERAIIQQVEAKKAQVREANLSKGAAKAETLALAAGRKETISLARSIKGDLTPTMRTMIGNMTAAEAKAAGATVKIDKMGNAVVRLPSGKTIKLRVDAETAAARLHNVRGLIAGIPRLVTTRVDVHRNVISRTTGGGVPQDAKGAIHKMIPMADGGMLFRGKPIKPMASGFASIVPPGTPRLIGDNRNVRESFIPHDRSRRSIGLLKETNRLMGNPVGGQGTAPVLNTAQIAQAVSAAIMAALSNLGVQVSIGGEKIAEIADVAVTRHNRATVRGVKAGVGRNR